MGKRSYGAPPVKSARKGQKYQIGVIVAGPTKKAIVDSTKVSGRSISREAEHLIERALAYDRVMAAMGAGGLEQLIRGELRRAGYVPARDLATGKMAWLEPGHPAIVGHSGFEAIKPGEWEAHSAAMAASDEEIERRNAEAIRRSNVGAVFDVDASLKRADEIGRMVSADPQPNRDAYDLLADEVEEKKDNAA